MATSDQAVLGYDQLLYFWQQLSLILNGKVNTEAGKGLSTNDFTNALLEKLNGIAPGATNVTVENVLTSSSTTNALSAAQGANLQNQITELDNQIIELGTGDMKKSVYDPNDDGVVDNSSALGGNPPSYYAQATGANLIAAFTVAAQRANIETTDTYPVILGKLAAWYNDLAAVAWSGSYNDLTDQPTIPTVPIQTISVNGSNIQPQDNNVNITVPTMVSQLTDAGNYALKSEITGVYQFMGSVATYDDLPSSGVSTGDVYNVTDTDMNYAWTGTAWDAMGSTFTLTYITNQDIDTIMAS